MRGLIQRRDLILLGLGIVLGSVLILSSNFSKATIITNSYSSIQKQGTQLITYICTTDGKITNLLK